MRGRLETPLSLVILPSILVHVHKTIPPVQEYIPHICSYNEHFTITSLPSQLTINPFSVTIPTTYGAIVATLNYFDFRGYYSKEHEKILKS
jgi:hypothetical protein